MDIETIETLAEDSELLEIGRLAIEDELIELRDARIATLRNNGLVCKERDGAASPVIRMGPEHAVSVALKAIAKRLREQYDT